MLKISISLVSPEKNGLVQRIGAPLVKGVVFWYGRHRGVIVAPLILA